ncbi:hypothetical protein Poli38472_013647 [Pythium oligandrum]|uniref:Enoyl reductase (ER) domain-containing protein n=1 Tax=Pythium oligandrum TaxID=41045 RepID=A0A8K1FHN2_PYTOL|nr:hypothetical protein Poli38472_013647 [Pythium oligandrum]|eukprot:TMW61184.1 hypothetical protein Poli38472_013647 [Pythium oligandrum]
MGKGERTGHDIRATGCKAKICASVHRGTHATNGPRFHVQITSQNTTHNHPVCKDSWKHYCENRKITDVAAINQAREYVIQGTGFQELVAHARKATGDQVKSKDVWNLVAKVRKLDRSSTMTTSYPATFCGYVAEGFGNPLDMIKLRSDLNHGPLQPSSIRIRVHTAAVNPTDCKFVQMGHVFGLPSPTSEKPLRLGVDVAGTIVQVGSEVTDLKVGDEVYGMPTLATMGTLAEYVDIEAQHAAPKPASLSFHEAGGMPAISMTSYQAMTTHGQLKPGQRVLILGGSSSTGITGAQIAKAVGASFVVATTSTRNLDFVKQFGVDQAIDYTSEKWWGVLEPHSIDLIYDCGVEPTAWGGGAQRVLKKDTGRLVTIGMPITPSESPIGATYVPLGAKPRRADYLALNDLIESAEEKLHIWLEDHKTKDQWVSRDLTVGEFTTEKSVIPNATIVDYAERFVECLGATPDDAKNAFERVLATPAKDKSRQLTLSFIFAWSTFVTSLVYTFKLNMIPLERVDVLAAQIRDFQDELRVLSAVVKDVRTRQSELGFVEFESVGSVARNNPLKWKVVTGDMDGHFDLDSKNLSVSVKHAGLYSLQVQVLHASSYAGAQFNLQVNGISVRQCHECIQFNDYNHRANTAYASAQRSSSVSVTRQLKSGDAVTAVFEGDGLAMEGSLLTITRLR